jgi:hypothetical protein
MRNTTTMHGVVRAFMIASIAALMMPGCYYDVEEELYPPSCDTTVTTFSGTINEIIQSRCATPGCHVPGGTGPGDFTTYSGLQPKLQDGSFESQVLVNKAMPPTGTLSTCDLNKIQKWVNNGAQNN